MEPQTTVSPFACNMTAIPENEREAHEKRAIRLYSQEVLEARELSDGHAFRFDPTQYQELVTYIANERLCCSFLHFTLDVASDHGDIWLHVTGREGVKSAMEVAYTEVGALSKLAN